MAELFEIPKGGKAHPIAEFAFQDEVNDLEPFLKQNPKVLGDGIRIFSEQVDTGVGGRIDLLALDQAAGSSQIVIIELKNSLAEQPVLLQTLRYASWIRNNPDSIKYILEKERISIENVEFNPKIIIVAPQVDPSLLELSQYTGAFEFDFIEVRRFGSKEGCFLIVDHKVLPQTTVAKVRSQEEWNWESYETRLGIGKDQIEIGKQLFNNIMTICEEKQWNLVPRFNQMYIPFKFGFFNVILLSFWNGQCDLGFKLGQSPEKLNLNDPYTNSRGKFWNNSGEFYVGTDSENFDITKYIPFMEAAYRNVTKK